MSVFFLDGLLIDTGPAKKEAELLSLLDHWKIEQVVLTHHHEDHTGMAHWLGSHLDVPIYMHESGIVQAGKRARLPFYRHMFWGKRLPFSAQPLGTHFKTEHYHWEVIHTPGHTHDHVALYNLERKWMFGGDLFVGPKPKSAFRFESIPDMIRSLHKVLAYDFDVYICSHSGVIFEGKKVLRQKLHYLLKVQQQVLFLHNEGKTVKQIQKRLFPKRHFMHYVSLFENSPKHFVRSVLQGY